MLLDAIRRMLLIAEQAGFYSRFGFIPSPLRQQQLLLLLKDARKTLVAASQPVHQSKRLLLYCPLFLSLGCPQQNGQKESTTMHTFSAVIERCPETGLIRGYIPGFPGAHSQGETIDELQANLEEVIAMLLEDGEPTLESDFVGLQQISVAA